LFQFKPHIPEEHPSYEGISQLPVEQLEPEKSELLDSTELKDEINFLLFFEWHLGHNTSSTEEEPLCKISNFDLQSLH
jgi:hypothetical protein